jgi:hypothetical protein
MPDYRHPYSDAPAFLFVILFLTFKNSLISFAFSRSCLLQPLRHRSLAGDPSNRTVRFPLSFACPLFHHLKPVMQHTMLIPTRVVHDDTLLIILRLFRRIIL